MGRALPALLLAALVAGCQEENPLETNFSYTGVWEAAAFEGATLVLELEDRGDELAGNIYLRDVTGGLGDPIPIRDGVVRGETIYFTYDFSGETVDGVPADTVHFRGSRRADDVLDMVQRACWPGADCVEVPFSVVRGPSGF